MVIFKQKLCAWQSSYFSDFQRERQPKNAIRFTQIERNANSIIGSIRAFAAKVFGTKWRMSPEHYLECLAMPEYIRRSLPLTRHLLASVEDGSHGFRQTASIHYTVHFANFALTHRVSVNSDSLKIRPAICSTSQASVVWAVPTWVNQPSGHATGVTVFSDTSKRAPKSPSPI